MALTNCYITLDDIKTELMPNNAQTFEFDTRLEVAISAASRQIDAFCGRRFWQDATVVAREFFADDTRCVRVDDISTSTGLIVKTDDDEDGTFETTLTIGTDFLLMPRNADKEYPVQPWTELIAVSMGTNWFPVAYGGRPGVQVTAKFGWPAIPDDVAKACLIQATMLYKASDAAFGAVQLSIDAPALRLGGRLNPLAAGLLERYVKQPA
jgi:hypothetical protein